MPLPPPIPLPENAGLAFLGEERWKAAQLTARDARAFSESTNPTGRPNADALRRFLGFAAGRINQHTHVDFALHFTEQEAALYLKPFAKLHSSQKNPGKTWWLNPHAQPALRTALARLERYLATPLAAKNPAWDWIDSQVLPDASLLAVARDDDFTHGLLQSRFFDRWWRKYSPRLSPLDIVTAFPFPWPPATLLSSLSRAQEEQRHAIARTARSGEQDQLNAAVATAYGWPGDLADEEIIACLIELNRERSGRFESGAGVDTPARPIS